MASPFINPSAKYWFETARNTGTPRPFTPIIDAITTMANAIIIVWLIPANIFGRANGICTPKSFCLKLAPKASAASNTSLSTNRIPRFVSRIIGGIA